MQANSRIDVLPGPYATATETLSGGDPRITRQRWRLLLATFLVTTIIGLGYVWLRAPLYQSYAILHLSYSQPNLESISRIASEQLNIHHQRLTSQRVIALLAQRLAEQRQLHFTLEQLDAMLSVTPVAESRVLKLSAIDTAPQVLLPIVETWVELYLSLQTGEQEAASSDKLIDLQGKLATLEDKIATQRRALTGLTTENEIVSLERDESSVLNQIKGLSKALDVASEERANATSTLQAIDSAIAEGKMMVRPQDQRSLDNMEDRALALEEQLFQLAQQFTPEYMALDPKIVGITNNLASLKAKIAERRRESQQTYRDEIQQAVEASALKETDLRNQLRSLQSRAQAFSHRLSEYAGMSLDLDQLQAQAQLVQEQIIEAEVRKPFQASIDILEPPLQPGFPIGPDYVRDSGLVLLLAIILSLLTLGIYTLINRQHRPGVIFSTYSLNSKLALSLMLGGVGENELLRLSSGDFDEESGQLTVPGQFQRLLGVPERTLETLQRVQAGAGNGLWTTPGGEELTLEELDLMLAHSSEDAALDAPAPLGLKDIRLTYLLFLARQGGKLSAIERVAGYLSAAEITRCRQVTTTATPAAGDISITIHPAIG